MASFTEEVNLVFNGRLANLGLTSLVKEATGVGVGIFLRSNMLYQIRPDLTLHKASSESIFIELDKNLYHKSKNMIMELLNGDIDEL